MNCKFLVLLLFCFLFLKNSTLVYSQETKINFHSIVKGRLIDSTHNLVLQSATVALYDARDNKLISYQLSNNFGNFQIKNAPIMTRLKLVTSYLGYSQTIREFYIAEKVDIFDLKSINMKRTKNELHEVVVNAPPMRIRGDTLEFNADAFKLDSNAVVEDMLRKLTGVTVWGDGMITVNGKKIKKLLVEGKEFFGGDPKIALQNLPKNSVDKIQVYQDKNNPDSIDSTVIMNVNLKKGKKDGIFGKVGLGVGTRKYYDGSGSLSYFSPQNQISAALAANNVNKTANSVNQLVSLNSYKGEGIDNSYVSDFKKKGLIRFKSAGFNFLHDFNKSLDKSNQSNLFKMNLFSDGNRQLIKEKNDAISFIDSEENIHKKSENQDNRMQDNLGWQVNYSKKFDYLNLNIFYNHSRGNFNSVQTKNTLTLNNKSNSSSESFEMNSNDGNTQNIDAGFSLKRTRNIDLNKGRFKGVDLDMSYNFSWDDSNEKNNRFTRYKASDSSLNRNFNRNYDNGKTVKEHKLVANINDIIALIDQSLKPFKIDFQNSFNIAENVQNAIVSDVLFDKEILNKNLTNRNKEVDFQYKTGLKFYRNISHILQNRYSKILKIVIIPELTTFYQKNRSQKDFQNLKRTYLYFTPSASLAYLNFQSGGNRNSFVFDYKTFSNFPSVNQIAPLVDSSNLYNLYYGNLSLKPENNQQFNLKYSFDNGKAGNPLLVEANIALSLKERAIVDSVSIDSLGINKHYAVNISGYQRTAFSISIQKAYKLGKHQIQISLDPNFSFYKSPAYLNGLYLYNRGSVLNLKSNLLYSNDPFWMAKIGLTYLKNNSRNSNLTNFSYTTWRSYCNLSIKLHKRLFFASQYEFNSNSSSFYEIEKYNLLNVDIGYRFLKGENIEIKFSALDLLRQNRNLSNYANISTISTNVVNVLQQHFMLKISYYPRAFGLRSKIN